MIQRLVFCSFLTFTVGVSPVWAAPEQTPSVVVQYRELAQTESVDGVIEAVRQSTVSAQISGRVTEIHFDVGDTVKKGQLILRIDEREAAQAVAGSQAQVMQAQASLQNAEATYQRSRQLFAQKFISQAALDKAQADYQLALAQAAASRAGAGQSALTQGYTSVIAPYSGVVSAKLVEVGEMVVPGKPLMTGFDPTQLRATVNLPQQIVPSIGAHPEVQVEIPALKRRITPATVAVQPVADARTHSTQVRVTLPPNEAGIYPGMFVRVHFVQGKSRKLTVPASAVLRRSEVIAVYVLDEQGGLHLRQVRLGEMAGQDEIEILAGLNPGDRVALDAVKAGMAVRK